MQIMEELLQFQKSVMSQEQDQKLSTTYRPQKIFHLRRLPYKQFDNEKYLKLNCSPLSHFEPFKDKTNSLSHSQSDFHLKTTSTNSPEFKELQQRQKEVQDRHKKEKQEKLKVQRCLQKLLKQKQEELLKYISQREKLEIQREKLLQKRDQLRNYIDELRERRQAWHYIQMQRNQEIRLINLENYRNAMMGMHYQGGLDIDPDNMTYEQLLQLQEKIGKVSKGINQSQYNQLQKVLAEKKHEEQVCSICYQNVKQKEQIHKLTCQHIFHCECIKEWLLKEKICPLCKQELNIPSNEETSS